MAKRGRIIDKHAPSQRVGLRSWAVPAGLVLLSLAVFAGIFRNGFVLYDDDVYITENPSVKAGLTWAGMIWAFTAGHGANWHPLTWISHMLDCQWFGLWAGGHHLVSAGLHSLNALLLFFVLKRMTRATAASAFAAALFAAHPLHVESVAWAAERKDVLSTLFWLLTLAAYARYAEQPKGSRYAWVILAFTLGLMAKPMLVTLPFVLLLLDYWPLKRLEKRSAARLFAEKIPMLLLAAASCFVTVAVQRSGGALAGLELVPLAERVKNAIIAYVFYLEKTFAPAGLAVFYPRPIGGRSLEAAMGAALLLGAATAFAFRQRNRRPFLLIGWLWYLGTLIPVIGLVQVGSQAYADRYTYVPLIGIFIALAWAGTEFANSRRGARAKAAVGIAGMAVALTFAGLSVRQTTYWRDSFALFERALAVTRDNNVAHLNLGKLHAERGELDTAIPHFRAVLQRYPNDPKANSNLGGALVTQRKFDEALPLLQKALSVDATDPTTHGNLGSLLAQQGKVNEALPHFKEAVRLKPGDARAHGNLAGAFTELGRYEEALPEFEAAIRLDPRFVNAHRNLAMLHVRQGNLAQAITHLEKTLELDPGDAVARQTLDEIARQRSAATGDGG